MRPLPFIPGSVQVEDLFSRRALRGAYKSKTDAFQLDSWDRRPDHWWLGNGSVVSHGFRQLLDIGAETWAGKYPAVE
jgi:hypothetical protein